MFYVHFGFSSVICGKFRSINALYTCKCCHVTYLFWKHFCILNIGMNVEMKWCSAALISILKKNPKSEGVTPPVKATYYKNIQEHFWTK